MLESGMRSSATTKIMAPAANPNIQGCNMATSEARMYPIIAAIGSTAPLPMPKRKDLCLLPVATFIGRAMAAPSGKFCMDIPMANPKAA